MEPRPPELIQRRGSLKRMNCAAHIWCWPTSVVTMASPPEMRSISAIRCCGLISVRRLGGRRGAPLSTRGSAATRRGARRCAFHARLGGGLGEHLVELGEHAFDVADDGHVGSAVLADFGGVDIDVNDLGVRGEGGEAAGDAVVEADAEGDEEIGIRSCAMLAA